MTHVTDLTPVEALRERAQSHPDDMAFLFLEQGEIEAESLTFGELDQQARGIAAYLQTISKPGERALLIYPTGLDFVKTMYGCLYAGVIPIPTNPPGMNRSARRLEAISKDARASFALTTPAFLSAFERRDEHFPELEALRWVNHGDISIDPQAPFHQPDLLPENLAFIQYTSGSTNLPKGVMISNRNLTYNSRAIHVARKQELAEDSVMLTWTPLFHDMGLLLGVFQGVYDNHISILMTPIAFIQKPIRWLNAMNRYRATLSGGPNFSYAVCVDKISPQDCENLDLSNWRLAYNSAEPVRVETQDSFYEMFSPQGFRYQSFFPCYGLAESTLLVSGYGDAPETITYPADRNALEEGMVKTCDPADQKNCNPQVSCGFPLLDIQTVIVDPKTRKASLPDRIGEIWVSGGNVAEGYWNRETETIDSFQAMVVGTNKGPFMRTGDLGFIHDDQLFVTGRHKDLIIVRGRNYYPQDIENTVQKSHQAMRPGGGAAFTVNKNGAEHLVVIQEVRKEFLDPTMWDRESINAVFKKIRYDIAREHGIRASYVVLIIPSTIPKTSSGKIMRSECQELFRNQELNTIVEWHAPIWE